MPEVNQYVRFQKTPPEKMPPPKGQVDIYFDPTSGELVKQTADGTETEFSMSGHTHVSADITDSVSAFSTSEDIGKLLKFSAGGAVTFGTSVGFASGAGGTSQLSVTPSPSSYTITLPAATGKLAITSQADGSITEADLDIPAYADDAAAATGGVAVGDIYRKTDGTVVWRQS